MPSEEYSYLSSTIIKDVASHGGALQGISASRSGAADSKNESGA